MINVKLNVVGLYYGETFEVKDDPTVLDVLKAADGQVTQSGVLTFSGEHNKSKFHRLDRERSLRR